VLIAVVRPFPAVLNRACHSASNFSRMTRPQTFLAYCALLLIAGLPANPPSLRAAAYLSHPPMRALPTPGDQPLGQSPAFFVDPAKGDDANDGAQARPWKTVGHALKRTMKPGDTLVLRGGVYYERVSVSATGTAGQPVTIRAFPGELAVLDGGFREFREQPATAWEPCPGGADGEFRSTRAYPGLASTEKNHAHVCGHFADSMVPLHAYRFRADLQTTNEFWNVGPKMNAEEGIYCGPGLWYNLATQRIHIRLAHTRLPGLGADSYRGETDPRKLPLIIAGGLDRVPLRIANSRHLRLQDLVVRGARTSSIEVTDSAQIEFDRVTAYGGANPMRLSGTHGFRLLNSACRGISAPWSWRGSQKYRGFEGNLFSAGKYGGGNEDFELAHSEFTDAHDSVWIGDVKNLRFHHNLLDNVNDDGLFLTAHTDEAGAVSGGPIYIYQNVLSRCLSSLAFGIGSGKQTRTGAGVYVFRNVFDLREPVAYHRPASATEPQELGSAGRVWGEHGSPIWEPLFFYHNTVITREPGFRDIYGAGLAGHAQRTQRRVFNNLFVQLEGPPGQSLPQPLAPAPVAKAPGKSTTLDDLLDSPNEAAKRAALAASTKPVTTAPSPPGPLPDFQADANLHWSLKPGADGKDFLSTFRKSPVFKASQAQYPPGWCAQDRFADPLLNALPPDWRKPLDVRLRAGSPALDAGIQLPADWPDPLRAQDKGRPDLGAVPLGIEWWKAGLLAK